MKSIFPVLSKCFIIFFFIGTFAFTSSPAYAANIFEGRNTYPTNQYARYGHAADLNGDSKIDYIVSGSSNYISVLLGNGDGTLQPYSNVATGNNNWAVTSGDFNGDGKIDLATANWGPGSVSILIGNGDGTFQTHTDYAVPGGPYLIHAADFNNDGKLDLVTSNCSGINSVSILTGNGDGTFIHTFDYLAGSREYPWKFAIGDFDKDGKMDVALTYYHTFNYFTILKGNGDATLTFQYQGTATDNIEGITVADYNNDGNIDIATGTVGDIVSVFLGNGNGTFQAVQEYSSAGTDAITSGDFDGDGKIDIATSTSAGISILLHTKGGATLFRQDPTIYPAAPSESITPAYMDNNGLLDLLVAGSNVADVLVNSR